MLKDPKMDAAYFGTFSSKPQGGAETQEMLLKLWASPAWNSGEKRKANNSSEVAELKRRTPALET